MSRLYTYCEGGTEKIFVDMLLTPFFESRGVYVTTILAGEGHLGRKGGVATYSQVKRELTRICHEHPNELVTTLIDYSPEINTSLNYESHGTVYDIVRSKECAIEMDMNLSNLLMNFELHEFEAYLYCNPDAFKAYKNASKPIQKIVSRFGEPELINTSPSTLPSRRLNDVIPGYTDSKKYHTTRLLENTNLELIRSKCKHFNEWLARVCDMCENQ